MSDPTISSQLSRQNLGLQPGPAVPAAKPLETPAAPKPAEPKAPAAPSAEQKASQSKQRLSSFLNKLETTWKLFNRSTTESDEGQLPQGKQAFLEEKDLPSQDSLKELRARATRSSEYLSKGQASKASNATGPKPSPSSGPAGEGGIKQGKGSEAGAKEGGGLTSSAKPEAKPSAQPQSAGAFRPSGQATSRAFLATTTSYAQLRSPDTAGKPGSSAQMEMLARQPVFSQSIAQVNPQINRRNVTGEMPVFSSFLDQLYEGEMGEASPLLLLFGGGKEKTKAAVKNPLFGQARLKLPASARGGRGLGNYISMQGSGSIVAARADIATRFAGKAVHKLLEKLYDEEELEELDEEKAVSGLGLILRLGGEFTYEHSTRVLDLALELADEVGVKDKTTRKEIKYGAFLRDIGEFDLLLQNEDGQRQMSGISDFLGGQDMLRAGLLHDIGKVNIPPEILYKPDKLTPAEYEIMKMHPIYGEQIVRPIASLRYLCPTIRGHHERWDGLGYPDGLKGEAIPLAARIISVADVFDALAAERPYKHGMEVEKVRKILAEGKGTHFDPSLVDSFLVIIDRRYSSSIS